MCLSLNDKNNRPIILCLSISKIDFMRHFHKRSIPTTTMSNHKQTEYRAILDKFEKRFGTANTRDQVNPVIFSVTGEYRNKMYSNDKVDWLTFASIFLILWMASSVYIAGFVAFSVWAVNKYYLDNLASVFDGEILVIDGVSMGVVIMTQKEEGELESRNFVVTNDKRKLINKLDESKLVYSEDSVVTWSIGSTTGQCIDNQEMAPFNEVEMGVDQFSDEDIEKFLDAHNKKLGHDGVLALMNSIGYGVRENGGLVYSDNTLEFENILANVVPRQIGATGSNDNAMKLVERVAKIHMRNKYDYTLVIVPRGDKTMPQGGSHSKQRVLEKFLDDEDVVVIEVSGKQTKKFELPAGSGVSVIESSEKICKYIKETKIVDENGKTHGSQAVFGKLI